MKHIMIGQPLAVTAALGALLAIAGSAAMAGGETYQHYAARSVVVRYGDLDLSRDEGVAVLYARLRTAARRVCGDAYTRDLRAQAAIRECYNTALSNAVATAGNTRLAALHDSRDRRGRFVLPRIAGMTAGS